ncbi:MAG: hypothetical protein HQ454_00605 [Acidimicrobiaceae bacterium]|nr:hypothetical protein [Acidimicrobiaceae bacterium]
MTTPDDVWGGPKNHGSQEKDGEKDSEKDGQEKSREEDSEEKSREEAGKEEASKQSAGILRPSGVSSTNVQFGGAV